jgi:hypothetical protein
MKKNKVWITINSIFAFVSAFIFIKAIVAFARFVIILYFNGSTQMTNFEMDCITWMYSEFWTTTTVLSIYMIGLIISANLIIISYVLYRNFRTIKGFLKLWFAWLYVISINQSIGLFIRDIPFKRDLYHALNWMYIPYGVMFGIAVLTVPALYFTNLGNDIKFLRMAPSFDDILSNAQRRRFFTRIAFLPALLGSAIILLMHFNRIQLFEIAELLLIIASILVSYVIFRKDELIVEFRIVKNEPTNKFNVFMFTLFVLAIGAYYYFTIRYY